MSRVKSRKALWLLMSCCILKLVNLHHSGVEGIEIPIPSQDFTIIIHSNVACTITSHIGGGGGGGAVAQSVERATPGEVPGSIPAVAARSLLVGSVSKM